MIDTVPAAIVLAAGEAPDWRIERHGDTMVLLRRDQPPIVARGIEWRRMPMATHLGARSDDGRVLTISLAFAACRMPRVNRGASHIAVVTYGDLRLRGCFLGAVPGERPLVD